MRNSQSLQHRKMRSLVPVFVALSFLASGCGKGKPPEGLTEQQARKAAPERVFKDCQSRGFCPADMRLSDMGLKFYGSNSAKLRESFTGSTVASDVYVWVVEFYDLEFNCYSIALYGDKDGIHDLGVTSCKL